MQPRILTLLYVVLMHSERNFYAGARNTLTQIITNDAQLQSKTLEKNARLFVDMFIKVDKSAMN